MSEQPEAQDERPRSGYARLRKGHHALIAEHQQLKDECRSWRQMYLELRANLDPLINGVTAK